MDRPNTLDLDLPFVYAGISDTAARAETYEEAKRFFIIPGRIHLVHVLFDHATATLLGNFEETLYPYGTERNKLFHNRVLGWQGLGWSIMSIPARDEELARNFFAEHKRRLDRNMVFTVFSNKGTASFPFTGEQFRLVRPEEGFIVTLSKQ